MTSRLAVREFKSEAEAAIAAATLRANGIDAALEPVGFGMGFHTSLAGPTAILASSRDAERAKAILDA